MRPYTIQFVENRSVTTYLPLYDAFILEPKGRLKWFQKQAWFFLKWCGALKQAYEPVTKVTRHIVDPDKFMEKILKQMKYLSRDFHKSGQRLLIGSEDYADLMCSPEMLHHHFSFDAEYGYNRSIYGLKVEVIPWMRGALVMPD